MKIKQNTINKLPLTLSLLGAFFSLINIRENTTLFRIFEEIPIGFISIPLFCFSIHIGNKINNKSFIINLGIAISRLFLIMFFIGLIFTFLIAFFQ